MSITRHNNRKRGAVSWGALIALGVLGTGAAVGYKYFTNRPGELAISYLPADAQVVLTVDLKPSAGQAATFEAIRRALKEEGLLDKVAEGLDAAAAKEKIVSDLRPHILTSGALALWGVQDGHEPENAVVLLAVDNPGAVKSVLDKRLRPYRLDGADAYVIDRQGTAAILDNYLIFANREEAIKRVIAVRNKREKPVSELADYLEARKALPEDANAMLFVSSSALKEAGDKAARDVTGMNPFEKAGWFSVGLTVRETGLLCSFRSPFDSNAVTAVEPLAHLPALKLDAMAMMPEGAYGLAALSQPAALYEVIKSFAMQKDKSRQEMEEGLAKIRRESGFDLEQDVLPAFRGEFTAAIYPGGDEPDALFVLDNSNGATPAEFAEKLKQAIASGRFDKDRPAPTVHTEEYRGAPMTVIEGEATHGKTPCYAVVDGSVLAATSTTLLKNAVDAAKGDGHSLRGDRRYTKMLTHATKDAKLAILVDLPTLVGEMAKRGEGPQWDWKRVFGDDGVVVSASYDGRKATGELFIPLNWTEVIHRIGSEAKKMDRPHGMEAR